MDFIPASSPKHAPLSVEERAQLDLLRILVKAGASLKTQDKIIDLACHYSLINKLHNGEGGFWIRRTFQDREPFLNDLAKKVETTGHRPHICNVVKRGGDVAKSQLLDSSQWSPGRGASAEWIW